MEEPGVCWENIENKENMEKIETSYQDTIKQSIYDLKHSISDSKLEMWNTVFFIQMCPMNWLLSI